MSHHDHLSYCPECKHYYSGIVDLGVKYGGEAPEHIKHQVCAPCEEAHEFKLNTVKTFLKSLIKNQDREDETILFTLWEQYCKPQINPSLCLTPRKHLEAVGELACSCRGNFQQIRIENDVCIYVCLTCGKETQLA